jgi:hypothetical protein
MNGVAPEVAEEVVISFEDGDRNAHTCEEVVQHYRRGAPPSIQPVALFAGVSAIVAAPPADFYGWRIYWITIRGASFPVLPATI